METLAVAFLPHEKEHSAPIGHPENADRLSLVSDLLGQLRGKGMLEDFAITEHGSNPVEAVHNSRLTVEIESLARRGGGFLDPDTFVASGSFLAARKVCDAVLSAVDLAFTSAHVRYFVLGRPPGHHAEPDRAMGFCLINHVAITAAYAIKSGRASRVAVVDFDVHHGNGTQWTFYHRNDVLYISTHQYPFYPGSGSRDETGEGAGKGYTMNFPLPAGTDDTSMKKVFDEHIAPALEKFSPDIIIVSAGFDGHHLDPLGGFQLTGEAFLHIGRLLREVSEKVCGGRIVSVLEGGYNRLGNKESIESYIRGLCLQ